LPSHSPYSKQPVCLLQGPCPQLQHQAPFSFSYS
jgi:hypothetical protein